MKKVVAAMSGGVDSSVAACLLQKQGYSVLGVMLRLEPKQCGNRCCKEEPARSVCKKLGIPFEIVDVSKEFKSYVIDYFKKELEAGRTPNPCIPCNQFIKFGVFFDILEKKYPGSFLATGHYVSTRRVESTYRLLKGKNRAKDQSYFLHTLTQEKLAKLLFPLGEIISKDKVRRIARKLNLPAADAAESQDVCFQMPKIKAPPGLIKDVRGKALGKHKGLPFYTIGQRGGLGISGPRPLYVVAKKIDDNSLVVGGKEDLYKTSIRVADINMISANYISRKFKANVAVRYHAQEIPAVVELLESRKAIVDFEKPALSPTPGQFAVFYRDEECLGGGVITHV